MPAPIRRAWLLGVPAALVLLLAPRAHAIVLPTNFEMTDATPGIAWQQPVEVAFLPDGRWIVAEKRGRLWVVKNGVRYPTPMWQAENEVLNQGDRGLLGVAVDPDFAVNKRIYVLYTVDPDSDGVEQSTEAFSRLARFTISAADSNVVDYGSRAVLLGATWPQGPISASTSHTVGTLRFGRDGSLLVGAGDGASFNNPPDVGGQHPNAFTAGRTNPYEDIGAMRAQYLGSLAGKILRIDPATGAGYPSNPFWDGNPYSVRSRVWAYGLRNPYRFTVRPGTGSTDPAAGDPGVLAIGDVGWTVWEDLNIAREGGRNFGWPCYEGPAKNSGYWKPNPQPSHCGCDSLGIIYDNPADSTRPVSTWHHSNAAQSIPPGFIGNAAVGGAFATGRRFPAAYRNKLFMADYGQSWIKVLVTDSLYRMNSVLPFASDAGSPVEVRVEPSTGDLLYVSITSNQIRRIYYTGPVENTAPVAVAGGSPLTGAAPLAVTFTSAGTSDAEADSLGYSWSFGDGGTATGPAPAHDYMAAGTYQAILTVTDPFGGVGKDTVVVAVLPGTGFPATAVLDNFQRANGPLGPNWTGDLAGLGIDAGGVTSTDSATAIWAPTVFGFNQEVFVRLDALSAGAPEHNLVLKAQGTSTSSAQIEVLYDVAGGRLQVWTYDPGQGWVQRGADLPASFTGGDRFGARAFVDGTVEAFKNGLSLGTRSVGDWPHAASGGRIGFSLLGAPGARLDDFGGGTLAFGPNTAPVAQVLSPPDGAFYATGDTIPLAGSATDLQSDPDSLVLGWTVDIVRGSGTQAAAYVLPGSAPLFTGQDWDDGSGVHLLAHFRAADPAGLADTVTVRLNPEIDLAPSAVAGVGDTVLVGQPWAVSFHLRNLGRMPAPPTRWRLTAGDTLLAEGDTLVAGLDSVAVALALPPRMPAGSHALTLAMDVQGAVVETSETDNTSARAIVVVSPPNTPPVATILGPPDSSFYATGDSIRLVGQATDAEDPPASLARGWEVDLIHNTHVHPNSYSGPGDSLVLVGEDHDDGTGVHLLARYLATDGGGLSDTAVIRLFPETDLAPGPVTTRPSAVGTTAPGLYEFTLHNLRRMPAPYSRWRLMSGDSLLAEGDTLVAGLDSVRLALVLPPRMPAGSHALTLTVDALSQVVETDEANDVWIGTLTVVTGPGPDEVPPLFLTAPAATPAEFLATLGWTTNEPAAATLHYGLGDALTDSVVIAARDTAHTATLYGLAPDQRYSFRVVARDTAGNWSASAVDTFRTLTGVTAVAAAPPALRLSSPYPNPTQGRVALELALPQRASVRFGVVDVAGREVWSAPAEERGAGRWRLEWPGTDVQGAPVPPGIYYVRIQAQGQVWHRRVALIR